MVEKPWGRDVLPAPFTAPVGQRIGEVWFEPPPLLPELMIKYIFTSEKLSVQVHPSDAQLPGHGKEECWLVIAAEPGAALGVGFRDAIDARSMREAALDGSIEHLLEWYPVSPGDFFYIPAGTVHAIGAGVGLIEVQLTSDVTYRLYDYGRPRELHLDAGIAVANGQPHSPVLRKRLSGGGSVSLVKGPLFRLDRIAGEPSETVLARYGVAPMLAVPLDRPVTIGDEVIAPGSCGLSPSLASIDFANDGLCLIAQPC
ncbi:MAG: class I mannose-6-phosphate isomerase [Novosphingobium sp.]